MDVEKSPAKTDMLPPTPISLSIVGRRQLYSWGETVVKRRSNFYRHSQLPIWTTHHSLAY